jgi:hypothetical protein
MLPRYALRKPVSKQKAPARLQHSTDKKGLLSSCASAMEGLRERVRMHIRSMRARCAFDARMRSMIAFDE